MKLSVGKIAFPIEFDNGDKDVIEFNPSDPELATRLMNAKDIINQKLEAVEADDITLEDNDDIALPETIDGYDDLTDEQQEALAKRAEATASLIERTNNIIYEEIDRAFNGDISRVVFKHCSPLSPIDGKYYISHFLEAITPEIQKYIKQSNAEVEKKMAKHIAKYQKK